MTARRLRGLEALKGATAEAARALWVLNIGDIPRVGLTIKEAAASTGMPESRIKRGCPSLGSNGDATKAGSNTSAAVTPGSSRSAN